LKRLDNDTVDELVSVLDNAKKKQVRTSMSHARQPSLSQTLNEFDYRVHYPDAVPKSPVKKGNMTSEGFH